MVTIYVAYMFLNFVFYSPDGVLVELFLELYVLCMYCVIYIYIYIYIFFFFLNYYDSKLQPVFFTHHHHLSRPNKILIYKIGLFDRIMVFISIFCVVQLKKTNYYVSLACSRIQEAMCIILRLFCLIMFSHLFHSSNFTIICNSFLFIFS